MKAVTSKAQLNREIAKKPTNMMVKMAAARPKKMGAYESSYSANCITAGNIKEHLSKQIAKK